MLNPFIQLPPSGKPRKPQDETEEAYAQMYGTNMDCACPKPTMGLFVGKLLIRMGTKLTKEQIRMESTREHA